MPPKAARQGDPFSRTGNPLPTSFRDPHLTLADVQWVLGHAHITTTEIYTAPTPDEVIAHVLAHHERQRTGQANPPAPPAPGYRPEVLAALFGTSAPGGEHR